jgi:WXG100 family type VII secretion target
VGVEFKRASQESLELMKRLQQAVRGLESSWEGQAQQRFFAQYRDWETTMRQCTRFLESVGAQLESVAVDYSEADSQLGRRMQL